MTSIRLVIFLIIYVSLIYFPVHAQQDTLSTGIINKIEIVNKVAKAPIRQLNTPPDVIIYINNKTYNFKISNIERKNWYIKLLENHKNQKPIKIIKKDSIITEIDFLLKSQE